MSKLREIRVFRVKNEQFPLATSSNVLVTVKIKQNKAENTRSLNLYDTDQTSITPTNVWSVHTLSNWKLKLKDKKCKSPDFISPSGPYVWNIFRKMSHQAILSSGASFISEFHYGWIKS